jgi:hypothetical protein
VNHFDLAESCFVNKLGGISHSQRFMFLSLQK